MFNNNKLLITGFVLVGSIMMSCSNTDPVSPAVKIENPTAYVFTRNGASTVSFDGQTTRIAMAEEIIAALKDNSLTNEKISAMMNHKADGLDFSTSELNASSKNVGSKVAVSNDFFAVNTVQSSAVQADFDKWINEQVTEVYPHWNKDATKGTAGKIQQAGGGSTRYINANGLEYNQAVAKSLIGGLIADQVLNHYLSTTVLDEGENREDQKTVTLSESKSYTAMEHKWDEAYGYVYGASEDTTNPNATIGQDDSFLNKYIGKVAEDDDFKTISTDIFEAFKLGRAAIVAQDYTVRDAQVAIIRESISKVIAIRAVHYIYQGKEALEADTPDMAKAFHELSEGFGFLYSLQFTRLSAAVAPYFSRSEVEIFLNTIYPVEEASNGFWSVTPASLQSVANAIAAKFGFTVAQAAS